MLGVDIRKQLAQLGAGSCEKEFSYHVIFPLHQHLTQNILAVLVFFSATQNDHQYHEPIAASYLTTTTNHCQLSLTATTNYCQLSLTSYNLLPAINQPSTPSNYANNNDQGPLHYVTIM
jgi:hypothetical protein